MDSITGTDLLALIPQRHPFVMIGMLLAADATSCRTSFTITADNMLVDAGRLNPSGLIENMAQSAAAMAGYAQRTVPGQPRIGLIGDVRDFVCAELPAVGQQIMTGVILEAEVFDVSIVVGRVSLDGREIASCRMKIFHTAVQ